MNTRFLKAALSIGAFVLFTSSALAATSICPSGGTPPPGSLLGGGLTVDGPCLVSGITVGGGVTVASGQLQLQTSTVDGGIKVLPGAELDINATTFGAGIPTLTTATVNGGINITNSFDFDIWTTLITGGITVNGSSNAPTVCGNQIQGSSIFTGIYANIGGGPTLYNTNINCTGNTFQGTVTITNSHVVMGGNTIYGDLICTNSTVIPTSPNTVTGRNTCY